MGAGRFVPEPQTRHAARRRRGDRYRVERL